MTFRENKLTTLFKCDGDTYSERNDCFETTVKLTSVPTEKGGYDIVRHVKKVTYDSDPIMRTMKKIKVEKFKETYKHKGDAGYVLDSRKDE